MIEDFETCYRAVSTRDDRFDGWFFTGVTSTGIYCRPSCPALTPKRENVRFFASAAAAHSAGFRACKRCRPDAAPGSPEWDVRADVVARAMRLIADGTVDREGVSGLARRVGYSERQLNRQLLAEVGAGPLALARAQRATNARILIATTDLPFSDVAFAAGFASVRQFNDTIREVFAATPTDLRRRRAAGSPATPGVLSLRLPVRRPYAAAAVLTFLGRRAIPGVEELDAQSGVYRRSLALPHGDGIVELSAADDHLRANLRLADLRDLSAAVSRTRRLVDADADAAGIDAHLGGDPLLGPLVRSCPGRRVVGSVDGAEMAVRAVLGQQISVAAARTIAGNLTARYGKPLTTPLAGVTHLFPDSETLAAADPATFGIPRRRAGTIAAVATAASDGRLVLDAGADPAAARAALNEIPGVGEWTIAYLAMRVLRDPDAFPATDLGLRKAATRLGLDDRALEVTAQRWRPWRAYAAEHLWATLETTP